VPGNPPAQLGPFNAPQIGQAQRRFWLILDAMLAALVVLALVGAWAYTQVRGSLRELRAAGLTSLLEAETRGLQLWIDGKQRDALRWASTPRVQQAGAALAASTIACDAVHQRAFEGEIAPYASVEEISVFNLIAPDGRIVSSPHPGNCGLRVSPDFLRKLAPVFQGHTVFAGPLTERERLGEGAATAGALAWVEVPIHAADGSVAAALGFGSVASERFAGLLAITRPGTSRDAYAFDEKGRVVTEPRYGRALAAGEAGARAIEVRDPGGDLLAGFRRTDPAPGPLTALALAALEHRDASEGVLLDAYRNYRGAEVIGAWRWLPDARLAVAVEIEAAEAYGPLDHLQAAFGVLAALVLVSMTAAASTSLWAMRVRLREARRVGAYEIDREIGGGGMSDVYLAHHTHLKRSAAVKILKPHLATDEAVARFQREAQLCSQLSHPNTIEVYDYGVTREGRWYYAMEYLHGASLEDIVQRCGPMPVARVVHALRQACGSLKEAHDRGWVHRDVKPGNLMLCVQGGEHDVVKLVDFGLIKQVRDPATRDITQYSKILGTPLYMAPERIRDPADADARVDIYALAAVAWFALAGRAAFAAETDHDIVYRVMNEPAPPLGEAARDIPAALAALVARCLAKERDQRPADIEEVRRALDEIAREHPWRDTDARAWWSANGAALGIAAQASAKILRCCCVT
jgi:serine/threonine-protein kinase